MWQGLKYRGRIKMRCCACSPSIRQQRDRDVRSAAGTSRSQVCLAARPRPKRICENSPTTRTAVTLYFLAELWSPTASRAGRAMFQQVAAPLNPDWAPEDRDFKAKAEARLRMTVVLGPRSSVATS
jgi:hypothetical protein